MSCQNKENRKKLKFPHTGGSKSIARKKNEMELEKGQPVSRAEVFIATRTKKNGGYVNEDARATVEKVSEKLREQKSSESYTAVVSSNDALGQVLGTKHSGRVRGLGLGPCPSKVFAVPTNRFQNCNLGSSSGYSSDDSLQNELSSMKEKLETMQEEREMEQVELARVNNLLKYLVDHIRIQILPEIARKDPYLPTKRRSITCMSTLIWSEL